MSTKPRMIFHVPYPLVLDSSSGSGIRPIRMHDAFVELGYDVTLVAGHSKERAQAIKRVRQEVSNGAQFQFCYSESSTMPLTMTDPSHLPLHPFMDFGLFKFLRRNGVKVGHFLRDIYWAFPEYKRQVRPPKREAALLAYSWDLRNYARHLDMLYLPSEAMAAFINIGKTPYAALPPGHQGWPQTEAPRTGVHLLYVGGIGGHYQLEELCKAVTRCDGEGLDVSLTICTHADGWERHRATYEPLFSAATKVVHASGPGLDPLFEAANVAALYMLPDEYRSFAVPVKMFEYLGRGKPVIAASGSLSGDFIEATGAGWTIPYDADACAALLRELAADPGVIEQRQEVVREVSGEHTWASRAQSVADDLSPR